MFTFGPDEPIPKATVQINLTKPIAPGFRRPFSLTTDEAVDLQADGVNFFVATPTAGDSTVVFTRQDSKSADGFVNGDGALGDKTVQISADGHVGPGDVTITLDLSFTVASPDATEIGFKEGPGADEPIPA